MTNKNHQKKDEETEQPKHHEHPTKPIKKPIEDEPEEGDGQGPQTEEGSNPGVPPPPPSK